MESTASELRYLSCPGAPLQCGPTLTATLQVSEFRAPTRPSISSSHFQHQGRGHRPPVAPMSRRPPRGEYIETVSAPGRQFGSKSCPELSSRARRHPGHRQQGGPQGQPSRHPEHHARRQDGDPARGHDPRRLDAPRPALLFCVRLGNRRARQQHGRVGWPVLLPRPRLLSPAAQSDVQRVRQPLHLSQFQSSGCILC